MNPDYYYRFSDHTSGEPITISSDPSGRAVIVNNGVNYYHVSPGDQIYREIDGVRIYYYVQHVSDFIAISVDAIVDLDIPAGCTANGSTLNGVATVYGAHVYGTANYITISSRTFSIGFYPLEKYSTMYVYNGGEANHTVVTCNSLVEVYGVVNDSIIDDGAIRVSGGVANRTVCNDYGSLQVYSGGVANSTSLVGGGLGVCADGVAYNTIIESGTLSVRVGGVVNDTEIIGSGNFYVYTGGTANNTNVTNGGKLIVPRDSKLAENGPCVVNDTVVNGGVMSVFCEGCVQNTTVCSGGIMSVASFGNPENNIINAGGTMIVGFEGAPKKNVINFGGIMSGNGRPEDTTINSGGTMICQGEASDTRIYSGGVMICRGCPYDTWIDAGGIMKVYDGEAYDTVVNSDGIMTVYAWGSGTVVNAGGTMTVGWSGEYEWGGYTYHTTVNSLGKLIVDSGGTITNTLINQGGSLTLNSGCFLGGVTTVKGDAHLNGTVNVHGSLVLEKALEGTGTLNICINDINEDGEWFYYSCDSAVLNDYSLLNGNKITITVKPEYYYRGFSVVIAAKGATGCTDTLTVCGMDGKAIFQLAPGESYLDESGTYSLTVQDDQLIFNLNYITPTVRVYFGERLVSSGQSMSDVVLDCCYANAMTIASGGVASHTTAETETWITVYSGGTATDTVVNGGAFFELEDGAVLGGTTTLTGTIENYADTTIEADGAEINLVVDGTPNVFGEEQHVGYISNLNSLHGAALSITVTDNGLTNNASYLLASGADGYTSSVALTVAGEELSRSFSWDSQTQSYAPITIDNTVYSLSVQTEADSENTGLYLTITETSPISDAAYEYIARKLAYSDRPASEDGYFTFEVSEDGKKKKYYFRVDTIWKDPVTGFDAILLERVDENHNSMKQAVLACGGTEDIADGISDVLDAGIGVNQFENNLFPVYNACRELVEQNCTLSFTGHSLGGALAQWFAAFSSDYGGLGEKDGKGLRKNGREWISYTLPALHSQIDTVVTFNSPGLPGVLNCYPVFSAEKNAGIKHIRHYVNDGDLVSMAGDYYLSKAEDASYTLFANTAKMYAYFYEYGFVRQHTQTLFFLDSLEGKPDRDKDLTIVATGNPNSLSQKEFSYLTVHSDINIPLLNYNLQDVLEAVPVDHGGTSIGGYWVFNKQYAKLILTVAGNNITWANEIVTRDGTEKNRKLLLRTIQQYYGNSEVFLHGDIRVGQNNAIISDGSSISSPGTDPVVRSLTVSSQDSPYAFFDFTHQKFIKVDSAVSRTFCEDPLSDTYSVHVFWKDEKDIPKEQRCFEVPLILNSSRFVLSAVYSLENDKRNALPVNNLFKADGTYWYYVESPVKDYHFTFTVDSSITKERAVVEGSQQSINKNTEELELYISDIDADGAPVTRNRATGNKTISVQVKTASNPDGITVQLQETELEGLYRGVLSVSALNLTDNDTNLTIVYEDADNGNGVVETIEKIIDIDNVEWESIFDLLFAPPENLAGTAEKVSWEETGADQYIVEYSTDNFEHVIQVVTTTSATDMLELPAGTYRWRVKADGGEEWSVGEEIVVSEAAPDNTPKVVHSVENGSDDLFFAMPNGIWSGFYCAQHVGSLNDGWTGTNEFVSASGKGRIQNLFFGSSDPNVLCLTDAENGDALFVDDIYTDSPDELGLSRSRIAQIDEIRAGAGDDIVDMTSQRFEYTGNGLTIRGGDGDDVIWTNKGGNMLFGDVGNDRIVGASGNDVIAGGIGDDSMHGGGGNDVFTFCDNWGMDTVEQLMDGAVTLWFVSGDESNWDTETLTYTDGDNSVTVSGVFPEQVTLVFGGNGEDAVLFAMLSDMGAFADFTSEKIFEESGAGLLATQSVL